MLIDPYHKSKIHFALVSRKVLQLFGATLLSAFCIPIWKETCEYIPRNYHFWEQVQKKP